MVPLFPDDDNPVGSFLHGRRNYCMVSASGPATAPQLDFRLRCESGGLKSGKIEVFDIKVPALAQHQPWLAGAAGQQQQDTGFT